MTSVERDGSFWTTTSPAALTGFQKMDGRASLETTATLGQYRVRYFDQNAMSEVVVHKL